MSVYDRLLILFDNALTCLERDDDRLIINMGLNFDVPRKRLYLLLKSERS